MSRYLFAAFATMLVSGVAPGQIADPNPAQKPSVFLGGPKDKKEKNPTSKSLRGTVTDETGKPLGGALVTLVDTKTKEKRTFITKNDGHYNFDGLSFTIDYEVAAQFKDEHSDLRKLSQYDHTPSIVRILEVEPISANDPPKEKATAEAPK